MPTLRHDTLLTPGVDDDDAMPPTPAEACWCSVAEAARALEVSASTVRRRIAGGRLTARRQPYRQSFRWLVLLPTDEGAEASAVAVAPALAGDSAVFERLTVAALRDTDEELRAIAARVDLTRHAVVSILERERTVALRQATLLEELAEAPAARIGDVESDAERQSRPDAAEERAAGSRRALLIGLFMCLTAVLASAFLALPTWSNGIVGALAVVGGLISAVEAYLVVTGWVSGLGRRRQRPT